MKISIVQTRPKPGDIKANTIEHLKWITRSIGENADLIIFPELSLTGYEPEMAEELAMHWEDERLIEFQNTADEFRTTIGIGLPTRHPEGIRISMAVFTPDNPLRIYHKQFLHPDEETFFVAGYSPEFLITTTPRITPAICYEISVSKHTENVMSMDPDIHIASVAKSESGVQEARRLLQDLARDQSMPVLMSNCVGQSGGFISSGNSGVWDENGNLKGELDAHSEGIIIFDTVSGIVKSYTEF